jgi:hypothetical protein
MSREDSAVLASLELMQSAAKYACWSRQMKASAGSPEWHEAAACREEVIRLTQPIIDQFSSPQPSDHEAGSNEQKIDFPANEKKSFR